MALGKKELVSHLAKVTDLTQDKPGKAVEEVIAWIRDSLKTGEDVRLIGLGTFSIQKLPAREGRNPGTGETMQIKASNRATFKGGKELKDTLNGG
ncbi:HU family DNA-binding protein [Candidatus Finniella inopinata]|uniref:HU family DNA-binding protein n=1 Tax=Candidatus Finniella inopinata TaxID=1696036 RepID=A0A4Q7DGT5_9PROT|nr:HU family DNA-binding protein [Candidatus Finniella inopinata]RZI45490.1 HU family DNA-binding protein [Candidatus Finniella inopinata]